MEYFTLLCRTMGKPWGIEFGSHTLAEVKFEQENGCDGWDYTRIIVGSVDQVVIDAAVTRINRKEDLI